MQPHDDGEDGADQVTDLRSLREQRGLSQTAVATFIGVHQVAVSTWEGGFIEVPEDKLPGLQQLFHVTEEELQTAICRSQEQWDQTRDSRFGTHLARLRAQHGVSRQMVAESADVTTGAVAWWESGVNHPTHVRLQAIAELFECEPRQLLLDAGWATDEIDRFLEPPNQDRNPVAVLLRSAREEAGLNQTQVAAAIGAVQNSVSAFELGYYLPNDATWSKLVDLYGLDPTDAAVARYQARRDAGNYPEVALPWPLDPHGVPRPRWFRQLRAHLALDRGELADRIGVDRHVIQRVEQPERDLPRQLRAAVALRELAVVSMSSELALRQAWQGEEIAGVEHLVGLEGDELITAARSATEVLRILAARGFSLTEMGDACGVTREAVRQWVLGNTRPRATAFAGLSELLGVERAQLEELRTNEDRTPQQPDDGIDLQPPPGHADRIFSTQPIQEG